MDDWVKRALAKWPNVPHLYGWLRLDRRGRWLIQGEPITRPRIVAVVNRNYGVDERGCWYFQNGPQRGYIALDYAPFILHSEIGGELVTHNGLPVADAQAAYLDEEGSLTLVTEHGPGLVSDRDLGWVLTRLSSDGRAVDDAALIEALARASGQATTLRLRAFGDEIPVSRCDFADLPRRLDFVREPQPAEETAGG